MKKNRLLEQSFVCVCVCLCVYCKRCFSKTSLVYLSEQFQLLLFTARPASHSTDKRTHHVRQAVAEMPQHTLRRPQERLLQVVCCLLLSVACGSNTSFELLACCSNSNTGLWPLAVSGEYIVASN